MSTQPSGSACISSMQSPTSTQSRLSTSIGGRLSHPPTRRQEITIDSIVCTIDPQDRVFPPTVHTRPRRSLCWAREELRQFLRDRPFRGGALSHTTTMIDHPRDARRIDAVGLEPLRQGEKIGI